MTHVTANSSTKVLVLGWQSPPHNGRSQVVSGLTSPPFTTQFSVKRYDTKLQNNLGQRKLHTAVKSAIAHIFNFKHIAKQTNPDFAIFVIGPGISFWHDILILRQCHQLNIPTVVRFIGGRIAGELEFIPQPLRQFAYRQLSQAHAFLSETHEMNQHLLTQFPDIRTEWTPNFIHEDDLLSPIRFDEAGSRQIVFLGTMTQPKGVEVILGAVDIVNDRYKTTFHFIGGESEQGYLDAFRQKANQLRHPDSVQVHGHLSRVQAHTLCRQCQIYTFPSQWHGEGQPASLIELMGLGLVPIVTQWRGLGDIVINGVNGLTIKKPDSVALAEQILYLLDNPERLNFLSTQARKTILEDYTQSSALNQYQSLLVDSVSDVKEQAEVSLEQ